jgi:hypothetical protein
MKFYKARKVVVENVVSGYVHAEDKDILKTTTTGTTERQAAVTWSEYWKEFPEVRTN